MTKWDGGFIPISTPSITQRELDFVSDAVSSGWVSSLGKYVDLFEEDFAEFCQTKHAVSCSNGTVAIQLALAAMGVERDDEVIMPDLSFIATANAVLHLGAKPVFVDVDPQTLCLNPKLIQSSITHRTKAILPVHLYGHPANMDEINEIAAGAGVVVVEDAAEAHGSTYKGRPVGGLGCCATFSFYGNKILTTGEGGMITTNNSELAARCRFLRDHAMDPKKRYWHSEPGYNFRLTNIQAALGCAQLSRVQELLEARKHIFARYQSNLSVNRSISLNRQSNDCQSSYWIVCVEIPGVTESGRDQIIAKMKSLGVDSRPFFYPMSDMPYLVSVDTPVAHSVSRRGINLPTFVGMTDSMIDRVCDVFLGCISDASLAAVEPNASCPVLKSPLEF